MGILHGHVLYLLCPYGKMLNKGKRQCLFGGHMAAKPTWPPIYVNLVAIWQDAGPDPKIYFKQFIRNLSDL